MNTAALPGESLTLLGTPGTACCIYSPASHAPPARNQLPELSLCGCRLCSEKQSGCGSRASKRAQQEIRL